METTTVNKEEVKGVKHISDIIKETEIYKKLHERGYKPSEKLEDKIVKKDEK